MKLKKYLACILVIILALGISVTAIYHTARSKDIDVYFAAPDNMFDAFSETYETEETSTLINGRIYELLTTTAEPTTEEPTTTQAPTEPTTPVETTEAIIFPPDLSANNYNDSPFVTVGTEYFDDAVFIGNSRLQGFILYSKVPDLRSYTYVGLSVKSYFTKEGFTVDGQTVTAAKALELDPSFKKVYLKFGINELGWVSTEQFIEEYKKIIEHIYSVNPTAIIYVQSVLPVSEFALKNDPTLSKEKILEYNMGLMEMASEYGACYLDVASAFVGEDGYMPPDLAFDGVHLHVNSVQTWLRYLLGHGIN